MILRAINKLKTFVLNHKSGFWFFIFVITFIIFSFIDKSGCNERIECQQTMLYFIAAYLISGTLMTYYFFE